MAKFDLSELEHFEKIERALHGDLSPLVELLRSDKPLNRAVRDYIADEIERDAGKRFRQQRKPDLEVRRLDQAVLWKVYIAKVHLALLAARRGVETIDDAAELAAVGRAHAISDRAALDLLSEQGTSGIDEDTLKNARRRCPAGIANPKSQSV